MRRALFVLLLALGALLPRRASAQTVQIVERTLILDASGNGSFVVRNVGQAPLHVTSIYARTTERDPRLPPLLSVQGSTKAEIAPGAERRVDLRWDTKAARASELVGHVVVESNDPATPQAAIFVQAERGARSAWPLRHLLSIAVFVPFLGGALIALLAASRRADAALVRWIALVATAVPCAIAVRLVRAFDGSLGRADGNDGYQWIERARLFGASEWSLGVDGLSMPLVALSCVIAFAAVLASGRVERRSEAHLAALLVLSSACTLAFAAIDASLFLGAITLAALAIVALIGFAGGVERRGAAVRVGVTLAVAVALLAVAIAALHRNATPGFLADGTRATGFAFPELARVDWVERSAGGARALGLPLIKGVTVASLVAFAIFAALPPLHLWLGDAVEEAPGAGAAFVAAIATKLGVYGLLRLDLGVLTDGVRWAAPSLAIVGAASVAWAAFAAAGTRDLAQIVARLSSAHAGLALLGVATLTPQGVAGASIAATSHALAASVMVLVLAYVAHRLETRDATRFGGLGTEVPRSAIALGIAASAIALVPGLAGFPAALLVVIGALPTAPAVSIAGGLAAGALGVVTVRAFAPMLFARFDPRWRSSAVLEPHGGVLPDLDARALAAVIPLAILLVLFGLWPAPLDAALAGTLADLASKLPVR